MVKLEDVTTVLQSELNGKSVIHKSKASKTIFYSAYKCYQVGTLKRTLIASDHDILMKEQTAAEGNGTVQDNNLP
jgi:hypothetical protein